MLLLLPSVHFSCGIADSRVDWTTANLLFWNQKLLSFRSWGKSTQSSEIKTPSLLDFLSDTGPSLCINSDWTGLGGSLSDKLTAQKTKCLHWYLVLLLPFWLEFFCLFASAVNTNFENTVIPKPIVRQSETDTLIHAFVSSCLDYCDSLFTYLSKWSLDHLQLVQNAAARLFNLSGRSCHITSIWASLHWLPIILRIQFKVLLLTRRAIHGRTLAQISDLLHPYSSSRLLRSSDQALLALPLSRLKIKVDRGLWNALPLYLRSTKLQTADSKTAEDPSV